MENAVEFHAIGIRRSGSGHRNGHQENQDNKFHHFEYLRYIIQFVECQQ